MRKVKSGILVRTGRRVLLYKELNFFQVDDE